MSQNQNTPAVHIDAAGLTVWYQALLNRYNTTRNANNAIDSKTSVILAAAVAILVFGAEMLGKDVGILGGLGLAGLIASIIIMIRNISLKTVPGEVMGTNDKPAYYWQENEPFLLQLIADVQASLVECEALNIQKAKLFRNSVIAFAAASVILLASSYWDFNLFNFAFQVINRS